MQQYIIGNWKMNGTREQAHTLATSLLKGVSEASHPLPHIVVCPSYPYLMLVAGILKDAPLKVGAQDCSAEKNGAFTGDVSVAQLIDVGCTYVIIGHSERRKHHHEQSLLIRNKLEAASKAGLRPILCVGETAEDRSNGSTFEVIARQLTADLPAEITPQTLLIAYEPLWAIGTGLTPTPAEVEDVTGFLKHELSTRTPGGALIPTLYGGSVTASNAPALLSLPNVNGLLIGGASLKFDEFWQIINVSKEQRGS
jgi:triosephosphate isomerase